MFSRWGLPLKVYQALCRTDLGVLLEASFTPQPLVIILNDSNPVADWSGYVKKLKGFTLVKGITQPHAFLFERDGDGTVLTYTKEWCATEAWDKKPLV
jgi:hypothetical protein